MYVQNETINYPITVGTTLGPYLRVTYNGTTLSTAGAEQVDLGTLSQRVLSTDLAAAIVPRINDGTCRMVAAGVVAKGATVYGSASGKVYTTKNSNKIGIALTAAAADGDYIEVQRVSAHASDYVEVAAATAVTNTTTETDFDTKTTIDGSLLKAGDVLKIRVQGIATATNSTDTLAIKLYVGGQAIVTTGAVDVANNDIWYIDAFVVVRVAGASGKLIAAGVVGLGVEGTVTAKPFKLAETSVDISSTSLAIKATATWSVANSGNSCRNDVLVVERVAA